MKTKIYSAIGLGLLLAGSLASCQDSYDAPELDVPKATLTANTTIAEFKKAFSSEMAVETPYKDETAKIPYIIKGLSLIHI